MSYLQITHNKWGGYGALAELVSKKTWDAEPVSNDIKSGDTVVMIYAEWTTGDSYGNSSRESDIICFNKDMEIAKRNLEVLRAKDKESLNKVAYNQREYSVTLEHDDGTTFSYCVPWLGYFESLDDIAMHLLMVV